MLPLELAARYVISREATNVYASLLGIVFGICFFLPKLKQLGLKPFL